MIDLILIWALFGLLTFLAVSAAARVKLEPLNTWDGNLWLAMIFISIIFPIGLIFSVCFSLKDSDIMGEITKERRWR